MKVKNGFEPTMQLRFIRRASKNFPGETGYKYILQQKWQSTTTPAVQWIDVPRYEPEEAHDARG